MSAPVLAIRVIGGREITLGRTVVRTDSVVLFAVLLYMGLRAGERVTRAELLELIWAGIPDASRRHSLRQMLYRVRRAGVELDIGGDDLRLDTDRVSADINDLLADGWADVVTLADLPAPSAILGGFEPGLSPAFSEWVDSVRTRASAQIRRAALRHITAGSHEGRWPDVELAARRCLEADPLNEEATLALAEATAMSGSKAEALRILDAYLWDLGDRKKTIGLPASVLRRRISDQPIFRVQRAGDPPLIARGDDLAWLNTRAEATKATGTCTAMLLGAPGIGKTAVMRTFVAHAEMRGWRSAVSRLQPSDIDRPMSVFVELLPSLLRAEGALGAAPESIAQLRRLVEHDVDDSILANKSQEAEAVQARIRTSSLDLLGAITEDGPMVLVLEDLHWIDRQSLRLLTWLIEHATEAKVLWLLTARVEGRFAELRESLPDERVPARVVEPLSRDDATALFRALAPGMTAEGPYGTAESAYDVTGGNPLFIREVAGHWTDTGGKERLPTNLKVLMRGRVGRLSPMAQRVLHCCAVLGRFAAVPRVSTVLELSTSELLACIEEVDALGLLGLGGEPGSLAMHDLWQEELVSTLRPASLALFHLRCGEVLETESRQNRMASMVSDAARHLLGAGVRDRALRLLFDAATYQLTNGLAEDALATTALAAAHAISDVDRAHAQALRLEAMHVVGDWTGILAGAQDSQLRREAPSPALTEHSDRELLVLEAVWRAGNDPAAALDGALRCAADTQATSTHRLRACLLAAQCGANLLDSPSMLRVHALLPGIARVSTDDHGIGHLADMLLETEIGSLDDVPRLGELLVGHERSRSSVHGLTRALRFAAIGLRCVGRHPAALKYTSEAFELAAHFKLAENAAQAADACALTAVEMGDLYAAEAWLDRAEVWSRRISAQYSRRSVALVRTLTDIRLGRVSDASARLEELARSDQPKSVRESLTLLELQCRVAASQGQVNALQGYVAKLARLLARTRERLRQDSYVEGLVIGMRSLGRFAEANAYVSEYVNHWRRDRGQLARELAILPDDLGYPPPTEA